MEEKLTLVIPDMHLKDFLGYGDYISDSREKEKQKILDFIIEKAKPCQKVIFLGDILHSRTNSSKTIRELVSFLERFGNKELFLLGGNHENFQDGRSALDFLKEIKNKNWHVITNKVEIFGKMTFLPHLFKAVLNAKDNEEAINKIIGQLPEKGDYLFHHHMVSDTFVHAGIDVNKFLEPILPKKKLEDIFNRVIGGHVHAPGVYGKTIVSGSLFCNEVGELQKYLWLVHDDNYVIDQIEISSRGIYKAENPTLEFLDKIERKHIIKCIITKEITEKEKDELKKKLSEFDAYVFLEQIPKQRAKLNIGNGESILEFSIEELLKVYAKQKNISEENLLAGFNLINN